MITINLITIKINFNLKKKKKDYEILNLTFTIITQVFSSQLVWGVSFSL